MSEVHLIQSTFYNSGQDEHWLIQNTEILDLRGQTSLLQLSGALSITKAFLTVDAGPLHIAAAVGTLTLAIVGNDSSGYGASPLRLWLPRVPNVYRTNATHTCTLCADNLFRNDDCLIDNHPCMQSISTTQVLDWFNTHLLV